jgi:hypothetical protein
LYLCSYLSVQSKEVIVSELLREARALVVLALLYGASISVFTALIKALIIPLGDSTTLDTVRACISPYTLGSLTGPPMISGAIYHATGEHSVVGIYADRFSFLLSPVFLESQRGPNGTGANDGSTELFFLLSHTRFGIHNASDGYCGCSPSVPLLHTETDSERTEV